MERQSNFELYRILCILLIVIMHTFGTSTGTVNSYMGIFINVIGNIGVTGFILLSGYFGVKLKKEKLIGLDLMMIFWSVIFCIATFICGIQGFTPSKKEILSCLIPVISHKYWFLSAYFILVILSPFINKFIDGLSKKEHKNVLLVAGSIFLLLPTVFFFDQTGDGGKGIVNMIFAYFVGRYIGIYYSKPDKNTGKYVGLLVAVIFVNVSLNSILFALTGSTACYYARDNSIFTMIQAVLVFLIFRNLKLNSRFINMISVNVVAVYVLEDWIKIWIVNFINYREFNQNAYYILMVLMVSLAVFIVAVTLEMLRKIIFGKIEKHMCTFISEKIIDNCLRLICKGTEKW